jgi:hypothetical protein
MGDADRILLRRLTGTGSRGTPSRKYVYLVKDVDQEDRK